MKSIKSRKQRKELFNAPLHKKRREISAHLEENLLLKYDKRAITVVRGDAVRVMRGSYKGHEDKIARVNVKKRYVEIEGITMAKADGNKIAKPIHASNLLITKLNLTDKRRREKLERGLSEETKKEIEAEAKVQIKEVEEEQKRLEEEKTRQEVEATAEDEEIKEPSEEVEEKPAKKETTPEKPKKESKPTQEKTTEVKTTPKKTTTAKPKKTEEKPKTPAKKPATKKVETKPKKSAEKTPAKETEKKEDKK